MGQTREEFIFTQTGLTEIGKELDGVKNKVGEMEEAINASFEDTEKSIKDYEKAISKAADETQDAASATSNLKAQNAQLANTIKDTARQYTIFGVNVGAAADKFKAMRTAIIGTTKSLGGATKGLKAFKIALAATGIGVILVALGGLVSLLTRFQGVIDKVNQVVAGLSAAIDVAADRMAKFATGIGKILTLDFSGGMDAIKESVSGAATEMTAAAKAGATLEKRSQNLLDAQRKLNIEYAKAQAQIQQLREVQIDESKTAAERIAAADKAIALENELEGKKIDLAKEALNIKRSQNALAESTRADLEEEAQLEIELSNIRSEFARQRRRDFRELQTIEKQAAAERRARAKERQAQIDAITKAIEGQQKALEKQLGTLILSSKTGRDRAEEERNQAKLAIDELETQTKAQIEELAKKDKAKAAALQKEIEQADTFNKLRAQLEIKFQQKLTEIELKEDAEREAKKIAQEEAQAAAREERIKTTLSGFELQREIAEAEIALIKESGEEKLTLEEFQQKKRLEAERNFLIVKKQFLQTLGEISEDEAELFDLQIEKLNEQIEKVGNVDVNPLEELKAKFLDAFGINEEEFQIIQEQAAKALQAVTQMLQANIDQQLEANERLIDGIQERIDTIQEKLEYEQEKRADGAGHSVSTLEAQLKKENELLEKAEKERIALEKEALRLRLAQQAAEVASNIGLAIAQLVATQSKFGIAGIITAAAGVSSIFALIKSAKAQAAQLSQPDKFEDGGKVGGNLHRDGGTIIEAEKDEIVINRKDATEHERFLLALNKGKYKNVDIPSLLEGQKGLAVPVDFVGQSLPKIQTAQKEIEQAIKINNQNNLENALRAVLPTSLQSQTTDIVNAIKGQKSKVAYQQEGKTKILSEWKEGNTTVRDIMTINE